MDTQAVESMSSVNVLLEDMHALDAAKNANCRFVIVHDLAEIVRHDAATARERIIRHAMRSLESGVQS